MECLCGCYYAFNPLPPLGFKILVRALYYLLKVHTTYCQSIQSPKLVLIFNPASCPTGKTTSLHYKHKTYIFFQKTIKKIINQVST